MACLGLLTRNYFVIFYFLISDATSPKDKETIENGEEKKDAEKPTENDAEKRPEETPTGRGLGRLMGMEVV